MDTPYKHDQLSVLYDHVVELNREESEEGRSGDLNLKTMSAFLSYFTARRASCVSARFSDIFPHQGS